MISLSGDVSLHLTRSGAPEENAALIALLVLLDRQAQGENGSSLADVGSHCQFRKNRSLQGRQR
jgi:hypothetical protein